MNEKSTEELELAAEELPFAVDGSRPGSSRVTREFQMRFATEEEALEYAADIADYWERGMGAQE
jgi:hypothetical protein